MYAASAAFWAATRLNPSVMAATSTAALVEGRPDSASLKASLVRTMVGSAGLGAGAERFRIMSSMRAWSLELMAGTGCTMTFAAEIAAVSRSKELENFGSQKTCTYMFDQISEIFSDDHFFPQFLGVASILNTAMLYSSLSEQHSSQESLPKVHENDT
jgi:hypothetical protein